MNRLRFQLYVFVVPAKADTHTPRLISWAMG
jgi:hypothetical protein